MDVLHAYSGSPVSEQRQNRELFKSIIRTVIKALENRKLQLKEEIVLMENGKLAGDPQSIEYELNDVVKGEKVVGAFLKLMAGDAQIDREPGEHWSNRLAVRVNPHNETFRFRCPNN